LAVKKVAVGAESSEFPDEHLLNFGPTKENRKLAYGCFVFQLCNKFRQNGSISTFFKHTNFEALVLKIKSDRKKTIRQAKIWLPCYRTACRRGKYCPCWSYRHEIRMINRSFVAIISVVCHRRVQYLHYLLSSVITAHSCALRLTAMV